MGSHSAIEDPLFPDITKNRFESIQVLHKPESIA